jgi:hypothetical protein
MTKDEKADIALLFKTLNGAMIRIELLEAKLDPDDEWGNQYGSPMYGINPEMYNQTEPDERDPQTGRWI